MSKKDPLVSVVMPAYNSEKYIGEAIESILNQTFKDFEFIIIDDGSTDGTWSIIQEYAKKDKRIVALRNEKNLKISDTLNRGILVAKGKYIARMDSDDWSYPDRLEKQVGFLGKHRDVIICGGGIEVSDVNLNFLNYRFYPLTDKDIRKIIFRYSPFAHPVVMYQRISVEEAYMYNTYINLAEDYGLYFRLGLIGSFANLPDVLLKLRTHPKSLSISHSKRQQVLTLYVRIKAWVEYEYKVRFFDLLYWFIQLVGMLIVPEKLRFWIFNFFRSQTNPIKDKR